MANTEIRPLLEYGTQSLHRMACRKCGPETLHKSGKCVHCGKLNVKRANVQPSDYDAKANSSRERIEASRKRGQAKTTKRPVAA